MEKVTDINQPDFSKQYIYADYLTDHFQERVERIKGWLYKRSPASKKASGGSSNLVQ